MQPGEGYHVDSQLPQVGIQLTREPQASGNTRHGQRNQMVQITISGIGQFQGSEADIIQSLIVNAVCLIGIFYQLVNRQSCIVRFNHGIRHLGRWYNRVGVHDPVWVLLTDLGDEQSTHSRSSATTQRVGQLESLQAVARFSFLADNIQHGIHQFST